MNWTWPKIWTGERGGWWRLLVTAALYAGGVALGIVLYTGAMLGGFKDAIKDQPDYVQEVVPLIGTVLITGLGLAGCLAGIRFVHRKPVACVFTDGRPFGFGLAVQSAALWTLLWFVDTVSLPNGWERLVRRTGEIPLFWWPVLSVLMLGAMAVGRTAEEVVFRGYLQTCAAAWVKRPWLAVCLSTLVFTLLHRGANPAAYTAIALLGIAWGAACIRAGTLAPMVGAHVMQDTLEGLWQPSGHPNQVNASTTWLEVAFIAVALFIWSGWLVWATRNKPVDTMIGGKTTLDTEG
jgi:membrane protease YdiL (CAAX protease family)